MIDLGALKEQLKLLGHNLPDDQILTILAEMNINVEFDNDSDDEAQPTKPGSRPSITMQGRGPSHSGGQVLYQRSGSILENVHDKPKSSAILGDLTGKPESPGSTLGLPRAPAGHAIPCNVSGGFIAKPDLHSGCPDVPPRLVAIPAVPTTSTACASRPPVLPSAPPRDISRVGAPHGGLSLPGTSSQGASDAPPTTAAARTSSYDLDIAAQAWPWRSPKPAALGNPTAGAEQSGPGPSRTTILQSSMLSEAWDVRPGSALGAKPLGATTVVHTTPAGVARAAGRYAVGLSIDDAVRLGDGDCDVSPSFDTRQDKQRPSSARYPHEQGHMPKRTSADQGKMGRAVDTAGKGLRPPKYDWATNLRDTSPTNRSTLSLQVSTASLGGRSTASRPGTATKKVDRVARYKELQQDWSKDKFLSKASGTNKTISRKPVNFHSHFASLHAEEAAQRERMLKETRTKTKQDFAAAKEYVAPTTKRRDELRWQTRMKMMNFD